MSHALATRGGQDVADVVESVIIAGDLSKLSPAQRVDYYQRTCESLGVNPLTKPFEYLQLKGKLTLYATRTCTDQLRANKRVSIHIVGRENIDGVYEVTARATLPDGRADEEIGAVNVKGLQGEDLANAHMKAQTKAKRRVTLSICGLGWLDESEVESVSTAAPAHVDMETGEVIDQPRRVPQRASSVSTRAVLELTPEEVGEIRQLLADADLKMTDLGAVVGTEITRENYSAVIATWLHATPDEDEFSRDPEKLVSLAVDHKLAAAS